MIRQLFFDFDGNAFKTFASPRTGLGLERACSEAVLKSAGEEAQKKYLAQGGLLSRAPSEIFAALNPGASSKEIGELAERFVLEKLRILTAQVGRQPDGSVWPPPSPGFRRFWRSLSVFVKAGDVQTGIVSSGHTSFIIKVWQAHGLDLPQVIVSDDDFRLRREPKDLSRRVKPGTLPLALARLRLAHQNGNVGMATWKNKSGLMYFGDDLNKDGGLALAAGIPFGYFCPTAEFGETADGFQFSDWSQVEERLEVLVKTGHI